MEPAYEVQYDAGGDVLTVKIKGIETGWEQWFLLVSDAHWDNPQCRRDLLRRHFDQARERNAGVLSFGDWFCAMQGRYDPRSSKSSLRPEHQVDHYLDALVDTAAHWLEPYRDRLLGFGDGNHETNIKKRMETDLTGRLCERLAMPRLGYAGWVRFLLKSGETGPKSSYNLFFHHGYGGGGPVTKGVIQTNRRAVYLPDANVVVTGHIHEDWQVTIPRLRLSNGGKTYLDEQLHLSLPTYKDEFNLAGGWHIERGAPPKPLGGAWLRFYHDGTRKTGARVNWEIVRAK